MAEITGISRRRYNENHNDNEICIFVANGDKPIGGACKKTIFLTEVLSTREYSGVSRMNWTEGTEIHFTRVAVYPGE